MRIYPGRFRSTEVTFGLRGRVVVSLVLLLPLVMFLQAGLLGLAGLVVWLGVVLPWALRDLWREVPHPGRARVEREHLMAPRPETDDDVAITDRPAPTRW